MDSQIDHFCRRILEWGHRSFSREELRQLAAHLRDTVQPQLEELERVKAEQATRKAS